MTRRMRFITWCRKDPDDKTPIHYTFKMKEADGEEHIAFFTSEDTCSFSMMERIRQAWIEKIELIDIDNEFCKSWHVVIYED